MNTARQFVYTPKWLLDADPDPFGNGSDTPRDEDPFGKYPDDPDFAEVRRQIDDDLRHADYRECHDWGGKRQKWFVEANEVIEIVGNDNAHITSTHIVEAYNNYPEHKKAIAKFLHENSHVSLGELNRFIRFTHKKYVRNIDIANRKKARWEAQHKHPLFNSLYQKELLAQWGGGAEDEAPPHTSGKGRVSEAKAEEIRKAWIGQGPYIPPHALERFTPFIMKHADADDDDVRQMASEMVTDKKEKLQKKLGELADKFFDEEDPTPLTERNLRRTLRKAFRQFNETASHILGLVGGKTGRKYVSPITLQSRAHQINAQRKWIAASTVTNDADSKESYPLAECIRTEEQRFAELYTLMSGQESFYTATGRIPMFFTLTAPARYHPNPIIGESSWDGSTVTDSHEWFMQSWSLTRATLAKCGIRADGFRVTEPHQDGAEHWHMLIYAKRTQMATITSIIHDYFGHSPKAVKVKADFAAKGKGKKGKATAASYMTKYLIKTVGADASKNTSAANDPVFKTEAAAADAWRSTWGIRAFQFFGHLFGKQTLWRELRRIEKTPTEPVAAKLWRAARGGRAHHFIAAIVNDAPEAVAIRETKREWTEPDPITAETMPYDKKGRVIGVYVNDKFYLTHEKTFTLETDYSLLNDDFNVKSGEPVTVIHKCPRGDDKPSNMSQSPPLDTPDWIPEPLKEYYLQNMDTVKDWIQHWNIDSNGEEWTESEKGYAHMQDMFAYYYFNRKAA